MVRIKKQTKTLILLIGFSFVFVIYFYENLFFQSENSYQNEFKQIQTDQTNKIYDFNASIEIQEFKINIQLVKNVSSKNNYQMELSKERINRLITKLIEKEKTYSQVMRHLGLIMLEDMVNGKEDPAMKGYEYERDNFLNVFNGRVTATDGFIDYLYNLSEFYIYKNPRTNIQKFEFNSTKVI